MKKIISILLCVICVFTSVSSFAVNGVHSDKIEQVYSKMPEIKAYVKLDESPDGSDIFGYVNSNELNLSNHAPFSREEGVSFIFMFDCSTSVSNEQLRRMKSSVVNYINNDAYDNDKFTIVSFGKTIDILADGSNTKAEVIDAVNSMKNNQLATVLFDAVSAVKQISDKWGDTYPKKRMCVIFTDAVDYTVGGTTNDELMKAAEVAGTPLYVVAINPSNKESIDVLGQVARTSGGEICVATGGNIQAAFEDAMDELDSLYEITFKSDTNMVSFEENSMRIWIGDNSTDDYIEKKFMPSAWTEDTVAPNIISAELVSDKELRVTFSEPVSNAEKADNYTVKKGLNTYKISGVLYDRTTNSAVLSFKDYIGSGKYSIEVANITDSSMEKNLLTEAYSFKITGFKAGLVNVKNFFKNFWWLFVVIVVIVVAFIMLHIIRKRKGIVLVDNKATFADNVKYEPVAGSSLPTHYLQLCMEMPNGSITNLDINIVQSVIFGRAESCEVTIDDDNMSRQHFAIEVENDMLFIQNLSLTNGTMLNGVLLQTKRKLALGDVIMAGQEKFTVNKI